MWIIINAYEAIELGLSTNIIKGTGGFPKPNKGTGASAYYDPATSTDEVGVITANPKLLSSSFCDLKGQYMYVNIGSSHDEPLFSYQLTGLAPNSTVTFTADVYNLLDPNVAKYKVEELQVDANKVGYGSYSYNVAGNTFNGNGMTIGVGSSLAVNGFINELTATSVAVPFGGKKTLSGTAKTDAYGNVTFYVGRVFDCSVIPVGLDNIRINGGIGPAIVSQKSLPVCPANPVVLALKQSYPKGTTYAWSGLGETGDGTSFVVTPPDINSSYPVTCKVKMGECSETASLDVTTTKCCTMQNEEGQEFPVAKTYIVNEDFGRFEGDQYYYKNEFGVEEGPIPIGGYVWSDKNEPFVTYIHGQNASELAALGAIPGATSGDPHDGYLIVSEANYVKTFTEHTAKSKTGGMYFVDLSDDGNANKLIYKKKLGNLCPGKVITFEAYFSSANTANNQELEISLVDGSGQYLVLDGEGAGQNPAKVDISGSPEWKRAKMEFTLENTLTDVYLQVVNLTPRFSNGEGDFLMDDIQFSVCSPPDVAVSSSLTAEELLDLCKQDKLDLTAQISETAVQYYGGAVGYLFQYSFEDPTKFEKPTWHDLSSSVQSNGVYQMDDPAKKEPFLTMIDPANPIENVYFRVVIGRKTFLENNRSEWEDMNALNPCRAVSISSIPIVAAMNCADCTNPNPIVIQDGEGTALTSAVKLCKGQSIVLKTNSLKPTDPDLIKSEDFAGFKVEWFEGASTTAVASDLTETTLEYTVTYDATKTPGSKVKYKIVATDPFPDSNCSDEAEIEVEFLPTPDVTIKDIEFCEGVPGTNELPAKAKDADNVEHTIKYYETEADIATETEATIALASLPVGPKVYLYTATSADGCVSEPKTVTVTVNANPTYTVPALDVDPFCKGQYDGNFGSEEAAKLPATATDDDGSYTITWKPVTPASASTELNSLADGSYNYSYTVKNTVTECSTDVENYTFKVNPAAVVALSIAPADVECGKTTVTVNISPATAAANAVVTYDNGSATPSISAGKIVLEQINGYKSGNLTVSVDETADYCAHSDDIAVTVKEIPGDIVTADIHCYMKSAKESWKDVQSMPNCDPVVAVAPATGQEIVWRKKGQGDNDWTNVAPKPLDADVDFNSFNTDKIEYEAAYRDITSNCVGTEKPFTIYVYAAPAPEPKSPEYCKDATNVKDFSDLVIKSSNSLAGVTYNLYVYDKEKNPIGTDGNVTGAGKPAVNVAGEFQYYARQYSDDGGYSDYVPFTVTVREAKALTIDDAQPHYIKDATNPGLYYCKAGEDTPTPIQIKGQDNSSLSYGVEWADAAFAVGSMVTTLDESAISKTPNLTEDHQTYYVRQYYKITQSGNEAYCVSDAVSVDVYLEETSKPEVTNVTYLLSEFADPENPTYPALDVQLQKKPADLITNDEAGKYDYFYAPCDASGTPTGSWSTSVPAPSGIGKSDLNGKSRDIYFAVKRKAKDGAECESENAVIKVTISDSPMPEVTNVSYCEGFANVKPLNELVTVKPADGKDESDYALLWIQGSAPGESHDPAEFEGLPVNNTPNAPAATVSPAGEITKYVYYIAQKDKGTLAIGAPAELVITVMPNPKVVIDQTLLETPCEQSVQLGNAISAVNAKATASKHYFMDNKTDEISNGVADKSGKYYAQAWLDNTGLVGSTVVAGNEICYSDFEEIKVQIDSLSIVRLEDSTTCPDSKGHLKAIVKTNVGTVTYKWSSVSNGSEEETLPNATEHMFESNVLSGEANDVFKFDFEASAGACSGQFSKKKQGINIKLDDGPVVGGKLTLTEADNTQSGLEFEGPTRDHSSEIFYTCGGEIKAEATFQKDPSSEFTWKTDDGRTVGTGASTNQLTPGTYVLEYTNLCPTWVKFKIEDASINNDKVKLIAGASVDEGGICENQPLSINLTYQTNSTDVAVTWQTPASSPLIRNGQKSGSVELATPAMSGEYAYTIKSHGCTKTGSIEALVKPYIKFDVVDAPYYTTNGQPFFVARRDSVLNIELEMTEPASAPGKIEWINSAQETVHANSLTFPYTVLPRAMSSMLL